MGEVCLPDNYAERMFELEAVLEFQSTIQAIRDLNDLYRAGIDYYVERDQRKATHLQKKMTSLLANPDNIRVLERASKKSAAKTEPVVVQVVKQKPQQGSQCQHPCLNTRKLKEEVIKFHTVADTCIQNMVQNSNRAVDKIQRLKRRDLNKQEQQLNDRILLKRVKSQQKIQLKFKSETAIPIGAALDDKSAQNPFSKALKNFIE